MKAKRQKPTRTPPTPTADPPRLADLLPDAHNRRSHPARNLTMLSESLKTVGAARSIVIDERNEVLAGNGILAAAAEAGLTKLHVVEADGQTIIAVRRRGLTAKQKRALALYDNRTAELATWNVEQLTADLENGEDLSAFFLNHESKALGLSTSSGKDGRTDPDAVPDERATDVQRGDLFNLGTHLILCGDSTKAEDVARVMQDAKAVLMNTDPPYGVGLDLSANHAASNAAKGIDATYREFAPIQGDDLTGEQLQAFLEQIIRVAVPHLRENAAFYLWHPMLTQGTFFAAAAADILIHRQIIWVKPHFIFGRGDYHWRHELCFYGWQRTHRPPFYGQRNQDTVWTLDEGGGSIRKDQHHPTQKPVELFRRPMQNHCRASEVVYEPFSGSGSQLIAAEQLDIECRAIELEPQYVQVAIDRWQEFTGQTATKVGEAVRT